MASVKQAPKVSVVLSFYNEENVLAELIKRLRSVFHLLLNEGAVIEYELIFVNDCSKDGSVKIIEEHFGRNDIVLINMSRNFGTAECVLAGFRESSGDVVIYMDSDLQDPPEVIPRLISEWRQDNDVEVVYTTRTRRLKEHWLKLLLIRVGYRILNRIADIPLAVDSGDFKLLSRRVVNEILSLKEANPYMRGLVSWVGFKQTPVFYSRDGRFDGAENTKVPVLSKKNISYWLDVALISFSDAPLKLMLVLGVLTIFISSGIALFALLQKLSGYAVPGWTAIILTICFMSGVQFMVLGIMGLYIGSIFRQTKQRPHYIIRDKRRA